MRHRGVRLQDSGRDDLRLIEGRARAFLDHLRLVRNYSPRTVDAYAADLHEFDAWLKAEGQPRDPGSIDPLVIRGFLAELARRGVKRTTIARKVSALRSFWSWMGREEIVADNPADHWNTFHSIQRDNDMTTVWLNGHKIGSASQLPPVRIESAIFEKIPQDYFRAVLGWLPNALLATFGLNEAFIKHK